MKTIVVIGALNLIGKNIFFIRNNMWNFSDQLKENYFT